MPPKLSFSSGLNLNKNKPLTLGNQSKPIAGQKRKKTIFDDDDGDDDLDAEAEQDWKNQNGGGGAIEITTLGGLGDQEQQQEEYPPQKAVLNNKQPAGKLSSGNPPFGKNTGGFKPSGKSSIFDDENDEGQEQRQQNVPNNNTKTKSYGLQKPSEQNPEYRNLSALHSSRKHAKEAEEIDPFIYSYDAVYDSIKAKRENKKKKPTNGASGDTEEEDQSSRYMEALMRSAETRKRDQMRARDRLLAKEREAEGDEFADKEKFVTAAYRAQQEEVKRMEEEEAKREKEEKERREKSGESGMMGFYRQMLARDEESHDEVMKATEEAARKVAAGESIETETTTSEQKPGEGKTEAQIAAELNARGAHIVVNDEGQVVDKRQLLSAGLNVAPKPKPKVIDPSSKTSFRAGASRPGGPSSREAFAARDAQRARQTEMIASQLEEKAREEEEAEKARQKELAEKNRSRKTDSDVSSARERYLARKREREAQQAQKKDGE